MNNIMKEARILLVDDVSDNLLLLESMLIDTGYSHISRASSAEQAFKILHLNEPKKETTIDLILMDIMMPGIDGIEACKQIKSNAALADIPLIMVTAKSDSQALKLGFSAGAMDYITKPVDEVELVARVRSSLALKYEMDRRKAREKELKHSNSQLLQSLEKIRLDLEAAGKIQRSLLPAEVIDIPNINVAWGFKPCDAVGGDLLNIFTLDDQHCAFYLFDVSGHGVQASLLAVSIHRILSGSSESLLYDQNGQIRNSAEVVSLLNLEFQMSLETMKYFTIFYGILNHKTGNLSYCQAGHPAPMMHKNNEILELQHCGDLPVGMFPDTKFHEHCIQLTRGTRVLLYSDGITEAGSNGEAFGEKRLTQLFLNHSQKDLTSFCSSLLQSLDKWQNNSEAQDDRTFLTLEIK